MTRKTIHATATEPRPILPGPVRRRILLYLGILITLLAFGAPFGGLMDIPISFVLKNKLHLQAHEVATFRLVAAIPLYLSFLFGFARDIWNPFGIRDRGFMLAFGAIAAALYAAFAFTPVTYATLLAAVLLLTTAFLFVSAAQNGLTSTIAQQHVMSGQVSALWNVFIALTSVVTLVAGGRLSTWLDASGADEAARVLFLAGAAVMAAVTAYAIWKPPSVFANIAPEQVTRPAHALSRLLRHRPFYPAMLIWLLWNFSPGSETALQYYLQNTLHATDAQWGQWNAIFSGFLIPTFLLFGFLCRRFPLRTLLLGGTLIAVPQMIPLLFIHSIDGALIAAVPIGLLGGIANAAYLDLIIRSCPRGLQGTTLMMSAGLFFVATRFGDLLGTHLYDHFGGFQVCVIASTAVYALILPVILLIPRPLIDTADGRSPI